MSRIHDGLNDQMKQHRESQFCWCCGAPVAPQTEKHRDGLCPTHRRLVEVFWDGKRKRRRAA